MKPKSSMPDGEGAPRAAAGRRAPAEKRVRIKVIGIGGAGVNAIDRLVQDGFDQVGLLAINTDSQALTNCMVADKLQIGDRITHGLGAGGDPDVGRQAAIEDAEAIEEAVRGYDLIFIAAGLGGGTGTGASPVIAKAARAQGALVLALVTLPFVYEGKPRERVAQGGLAALQDAADAVICIANDKLYDLAGEEASVQQGFAPTDAFLSGGVRKIWRMLTFTGLINIDFADLRAVLRRRGGETLIGFGDGAGSDKVARAIEGAFGSPLLSDPEVLRRAECALVAVTHGPDFKMSQYGEMMKTVNEKLGPQAACKLGPIVDEDCQDQVSLLIIASTGKPIESAASRSGRTLDGAIQTSSLNPTAPSHAFARGKGKFQQGVLNLNEVSRGAFEGADRTVVDGEDLDLPTFIRRNVQLRQR
ncbi:MAG: cell division protein FtsZ [Verrucomicrobiae bacterium]|nr:cell division protein FtsZ [Verrucomicrobiae bacterium]